MVKAWWVEPIDSLLATKMTNTGAIVSIVLIFAASFILAVAATPLVRRLALATGIVDQPNARKVHSSPIPLLGGLAMYAAFVGALIFFGGEFFINQFIGILLGATWVSFLGIWDDVRPMSAYLKLGGQVLAALVLILTNVEVEFLHNPVLNAALTILWVVGVTNALNLLDNMDGLSGGVAAIAALFMTVLAALNGQFLVGGLAAALFGASIGFLFYNFNPASIFMGDAGSLFLGFMLAAVGIKLRFPTQTDTITWMIPLFVLGIPIFDTTLVFISRLRQGKNPLTTPGKDHLSHRLVKLGLRTRPAVVTIYVVGAVLGLVATGIQYANLPVAYTVLALALLIALAGFVWFIRNEASSV